VGVESTDSRLQAAVRAELPVPGHPFGLAPTPDGRWLFVSLRAPRASPAGWRDLVGGPHRDGVAVLRCDPTGARLIQVIPLEKPAGLALMHNGTLLLVAQAKGAITCIDVSDAVAGSSDSVLGSVRTGDESGTVQVVLSRDERYAFASEEWHDAVSVVDLRRALTSDFSADAVVGRVPVDRFPVGMALSADDGRLYVTSQEQRVVDPGDRQEGTLTVVDATRAKEDPTTAVLVRMPAGHDPVRVALSPSGNVAWITARADDHLIALDTRRSQGSERGARLASIPVGVAPVGVALVSTGRVALVANSNRFAGAGERQTVSVVDTAATLAGRQGVRGTLLVGAFPREFAVAADERTAFLSNFGSSTVAVIDVQILIDALARSRELP